MILIACNRNPRLGVFVKSNEQIGKYRKQIKDMQSEKAYIECWLGDMALRSNG